MKRLTRARRNKDWFERAKLVVAAARDRAVETAQQRRAPSTKRFLPCCRGAAWLRGWRTMGPSFRRLRTKQTCPTRLSDCSWHFVARASLIIARSPWKACPFSKTMAIAPSAFGTAAPERQYLASLRSGLWDLLANDYAATYLDASFIDAISARR